MAAKLDKRLQLKAMKFNQRSQLDFTVKGLYGPKAVLWESLKLETRAAYLEAGWTMDDPDSSHHLFWSMPPNNILVVKKFRDKHVSLKFMELTKWLVQEKKLRVTVEPSVLEEATIKEDESYAETISSLITWKDGVTASREQHLSEVDLIICIGGDGTLLYTSSLFQCCIPPIISFHMGSLGFLAPFHFESDSEKATEIVKPREINKFSYRHNIEKVLKGGVSMTLRHRLECMIETDAKVDMLDQADECPITPADNDSQTNKFSMDKRLRLPDALKEALPKMLIMNDLVVDRGPNPYLTNLLIYCNGRKMTSVQGDGIIIATPTGSTAYSLAAGASMVHPSVPCIVVTPICPHSLSFRSIVVPSGVELMIKVAPSSRNSAWVSFDGRNRQEITHGQRVIVNTSATPVPSINNTGHVTDWFDSLAECLHWNIRKEQKEFKPL